MANQTQFNAIAIAHINAAEAAGTVAQLIRQAITGKHWDQVGEAYGQLLDTFGKRARIKGTKEFTPSTPADTFYTQVQTVTNSMDCGKLKPILIETEDGERWGLEPVQSRQGNKKTLKKLADVRESHAAMFEGRSYDEKMGELQAFADALGVEFNLAAVSPIHNKKAAKKGTTKGQQGSGDSASSQAPSSAVH